MMLFEKMLRKLARDESFGLVEFETFFQRLERNFPDRVDFAKETVAKEALQLMHEGNLNRAAVLACIRCSEY